MLALLLTLSGCAASWQSVKLLFAGDNITLLDVPDTAETDPNLPNILVLAMDGLDRDLLYDMLRGGELPELAGLLGGAQNDFAHAHFEDRLISTLPSSTGVGWATMMTGVEAAEHGVTGNEFFIRETGELAAPVPVTVNKIAPVLRIYTEGYANSLLQAPTVYEQMREREPGIRIAVAMHQYYAGADELILADRTAFAEAFRHFLTQETLGTLTNQESLSLFQEVDEETFENVTETIDAGSTPDVLTVYMPGIDHFAHVSDMGPDASRRLYLKEAVEPLIRDLHEELREDGQLENRYVVIASDHGHTAVVNDDEHSLSTSGEGEPPALLESAGYTVRPFSLKVAENAPFDTVLAYQGAMAYVYVADLSTCPIEGLPCDWSQPARPRDIRQVADVFYDNNRDGKRVPQMRGVLDMVLVRTGASKGADDPVFEVYLGDGRSQPVNEYLAAHPRPGYVDLAERLRNLSVGPHGDRAGDVILIAHNGDRERIEERYYFASLYHSWHGSPSKKDARVPLIVAHPGKTREQIRINTKAALQQGRSLAAVTRLLLRLRYGQMTGRHRGHDAR